MKTPENDELVFLPLGGSNEIGMNLNLYGFGPKNARKWIIVDLGVTFGDQTTPGVEIITPDPTYLEEIRQDILAIVLTHAHEDHIGAIGWLWPRIKAPVYATPFTAYLVREKLRDKGLLDQVKITEVPLSGSIQIGPFDLDPDHPDPLDTRTQRLGYHARRLEPFCIQATGKSIADPLTGAPPRTSPSVIQAGSATRACWPWSVIPQTSLWMARPAPKPTCESTLNGTY